MSSQKISASKPAFESSSNSFNPKAGEAVYVRSLGEIFDTLDETGCLAGLPFMPEMLPWCGKKLLVQRIANKACVQAEPIFIGRIPRCVVLQMPQRCDGSAHGGCQMGCKFFWRLEWLSPGPTEKHSTNNEGVSRIKSRLGELAMRAKNRYRCQATELIQIATPSSAFEFGQYLSDIRSGVPVQQVIRFLGGLAARKVMRKPDHFAGTCEKRTPTLKLNLKVGEKVRVRSLDEIRETLDASGCNRGLWFDPGEMAGFCEKELIVSRVLNRLIDEKTGKLRELNNPCVVLSEVECSGVFRRFCSRGMLHFWREIWLERV